MLLEGRAPNGTGEQMQSGEGACQVTCGRSRRKAEVGPRRL